MNLGSKLVCPLTVTKENNFYNIIANYEGRPITALEAVKMAGEKLFTTMKTLEKQQL